MLVIDGTAYGPGDEYKGIPASELVVESRERPEVDNLDAVAGLVEARSELEIAWDRACGRD